MICSLGLLLSGDFFIADRHDGDFGDWRLIKSIRWTYYRKITKSPIFCLLFKYERKNHRQKFTCDDFLIFFKKNIIMNMPYHT